MAKLTGWCWPQDLKSAHYVMEGRIMCGKGTYDAKELNAKQVDDAPYNCKKCRQAKASLEKRVQAKLVKLERAKKVLMDEQQAAKQGMAGPLSLERRKLAQKVREPYVRSMMLYCPTCEATSEIDFASIKVTVVVGDTLELSSTCPNCGTHNSVPITGDYEHE